MNYALKVHEILTQYEYKIAFAESVTGGALSYELVKIQGTSALLDYSVVTYSVETKKEVLGIPQMLFDIHGVVSKVISMEMAKRVAAIAKSEVGIGITGNAGPSVQGNTQVGEIWFSIFYKDENYSYHLQLKETDRETIIDQAVKTVYQMLYKLLSK